MSQSLYKAANLGINKIPHIVAIALWGLMLTIQPALADISDITGNIIDSIDLVPGLITGSAYLIGIGLGVYGIIKLKEAVDNPGNTPVRVPIVYLLAGGAMFALPIIYEAMANTIDPNREGFGAEGGFSTIVSGLIGTLSSFVPTQDINQILANIIDSLEDVPFLVSAAAYLLGLILGIGGILKVKEHVEDPKNPLKEGVVRLIIGGMLFTLPTVYEAMFDSVDGSGGFFGFIAEAYMASVGAGLSSTAQTMGCAPVPGAGAIGAVNLLLGETGNSLGNVVCNVFRSTMAFPAFLTAIAYLFGLFVGIWGILKIQDHVSDPRQTQIWDPVSKFLVAGGLFALPTVVTALYNTVASLILPHSTTRGFNDGSDFFAGGFLGGVFGGGTPKGGLDVMLSNMMVDLFAPMTVLINWFGIIAGFILIFIGITRLMKAAQDGARGPGGIGTIMTFIAGGMLISFSPMVAAFTASLFTSPATTAFAKIQYLDTAGKNILATGVLATQANTVIAAILKFVLLIGLISIMRGIFIMRGVAEGDNQASAMAGMTHILGGALAVNLGGVISLVQTTLGITNFGLIVS